jgi:hypothetical protein
MALSPPILCYPLLLARQGFCIERCRQGSGSSPPPFSTERVTAAAFGDQGTAWIDRAVATPDLGLSRRHVAQSVIESAVGGH